MEFSVPSSIAAIQSQINTGYINYKLVNGLGFILASSLLIINPFPLICVSPHGLHLPMIPRLLAPCQLHNIWPKTPSLHSSPQHSPGLVARLSFLPVFWLKQLYLSASKRKVCSQYTEGHSPIISLCVLEIKLRASCMLNKYSFRSYNHSPIFLLSFFFKASFYLCLWVFALWMYIYICALCQIAETAMWVLGTKSS